MYKSSKNTPIFKEIFEEVIRIQFCGEEMKVEYATNLLNTLVSLLSPLIYTLLNYLVECVKMTYHVSWNFRLLC